MPCAALDALSDDRKARCAGNLTYEVGAPRRDPILFGLGQALHRALGRSQEADQLYLDQLALAATAHVAHTYGGGAAAHLPVTSLAPWQVRRACDVMMAHLDGSIPLEDVANVCELSVGHFSRAFRETTGVSPHKWLLERRVEAVKSLLRQPDQALSDVAIACGFADQSHMTRVFTRSVGTAPGAWRRSLCA
jgi:transcriptional regulator GlxA family with amidase domain